MNRASRNTKVESRASSPSARPSPSPEPHLFDRPDVGSWAEFHTVIDQFLDGEHLFRGVANAKNPLVPSVGRTGETWTYSPEIERELFEEFKREAVPFLNRNISEDDDWAWLALAQHFGVPTRLLDWSESPHVALFFAVWGSAEDEAKNAGVYVIRKPERVRNFDGNPFDVSKDGFFFPRHVTPRITAQSGVFTVQRYPELPYSGTDVTQLIIAAEAKPQIRKKLDAIGVHDASVFADLEGLCRRLKLARTRPIVPLRPRDPTGREQVGPYVPGDPQKNQWGGRPERDGFVLSAKVKESETSKNWFEIDLEIRGQRKLKRRVEFHLHDSFSKQVRSIKPDPDGVVRERLWSYGAFTVGALVENTKLELDLAELPDAPLEFRSR